MSGEKHALLWLAEEEAALEALFLEEIRSGTFTRTHREKIVDVLVQTAEKIRYGVTEIPQERISERTGACLSMSPCRESRRGSLKLPVRKSRCQSRIFRSRSSSGQSDSVPVRTAIVEDVVKVVQTFPLERCQHCRLTTLSCRTLSSAS